MASQGGSMVPFGARLASPAPPHPRAAGRLLARRRAVVLALAAIVLVGFGLRAQWAADPGRYISSDEQQYATIALSLAHGHGFDAPGLSDPWHWAPGTPVLFAIAHRINPEADGRGVAKDVRTMFWAQAAVGTALILVVFLLAAGLAGPLAGLLAAALVALYPPYWHATGDLVSEPLGALTLALGMLALLGAWRRPAWWRFLLAGAALGAALLTRADLLVVPVVLGALWFLAARPRAGAGRALLQGAAVALLPLLVAAPWIAYASRHAGRIVPIASSGPSTLFVGTYLPGEGKLIGVKRDLEPYVRRQMPNLAERSITNVGGNDVLQAYARERRPDLVPGPGRAMPQDDLRAVIQHETRRNLRLYLLGQPLAFAGMEARKALRMWGGYYRGGTRNERTWMTAWHRLVALLALGGALAGIVLLRRGRAELTLLLVPVLMSTVVNVVFVAQPRHNMRVIPLLIVAGCAGAVLAAGALRERRRGGLPPEADPPGDHITVERAAVPEISVSRRARIAG